MTKAVSQPVSKPTSMLQSTQQKVSAADVAMHCVHQSANTCCIVVMCFAGTTLKLC